MVRNWGIDKRPADVVHKRNVVVAVVLWLIVIPLELVVIYFFVLWLLGFGAPLW